MPSRHAWAEHLPPRTSGRAGGRSRSTSGTVRLRHHTGAAPFGDHGPDDIDDLFDGGISAGSTGVLCDDRIAGLDNLTRESRVEISQTEEVREEERRQKAVADRESVKVRDEATGNMA